MVQDFLRDFGSIIRVRPPQGLSSLTLVPQTALFTRGELEAAFALIFTERETAAQVAATWFERFADEVDADGRFLYEDWHEETQVANTTPDVVAAGPALDTAEARAHEAAYFSGWSDEEKAEFVLSFSDFHFALVGLVSPELFERMRRARGRTVAQAERGRTQMARIVTALRG